MAELAHFQNFAKLKDTSVEFNDITVLAGKPGTGKSYVMKMMYAVGIATKEPIKNFKNNVESQIKYMKSNSINDERVIDLYKNQQLDNTEKDEEQLIQYYLKNMINSIFVNMSQISNNFEVKYKNIDFRYTNETLNIVKYNKYKENFTNFIFVETPLILEFHKHLDRRESKTPYHIESLMNILDEDYSFTNEEQDELIKLFSKKANDIIGGDIKSRNGSFVFSRNDDKDYNIFNASSGIKSIGLLQYLVTNKALKKGSVLFWEEPEVHLHPEWQLRMVELFIELMNAGVKIVFSTHSPYMADYLNAISKKRKISDRVSFNLLQEEDGVVTNHILKDKKDWKKIQMELLDPLEEIMWEYL